MIGRGDLRRGENLDAWAERVAPDLEDPHWKGLRWISHHPAPFMFPNGGGAHAMLVASYRCVEDPTADEPYWKLSERGVAIFAYVERVARSLSEPMLKAIVDDDHRDHSTIEALLALRLVSRGPFATYYNTAFAAAVLKWIRDHDKDLLP